MAPPSMWLAACSVMMLYVAVPHASCHPTPDDASHHEVMPYFQQHDPQPYYYDEEEEYGNDKINLQDYEPVLALKVVLAAQQIVLSGLNILAALYVAYTFFVPFFFQGPPPADNKAGDGPVLERSHVAGSIFDSLDFIENYNSLPIPTEDHCREQMICEMRHLMSYVTPFENIIRTYGMRVPGLPQGYQKALDAGSSRRPCKTTAQMEQCPNSLVTILLSIAKTITARRF